MRKNSANVVLAVLYFVSGKYNFNILRKHFFMDFLFNLLIKNLDLLTD